MVIFTLCFIEAIVSVFEHRQSKKIGQLRTKLITI